MPSSISPLPPEILGLVYQNLIDGEPARPGNTSEPSSSATDSPLYAQQAAAARSRFIRVCRQFNALDPVVLSMPRNEGAGHYVTRNTIEHLATGSLDGFTQGVGRLLGSHGNVEVNFSTLPETHAAMLLYLLHDAAGKPGRAFHSLRFEANLDSMPMESIIAIDQAIGRLRNSARCANAQVAFRCSSSNSDRPEPPDLRRLSNLTEAEFSSCSRWTVGPDFSGNPRLESVAVFECEAVEGRLDVSRNPELRQLDLSGCFALTELSDLSRNPRLEVVKLESCAVLASTLDLSKCPHLEVLDLRVCGALTGLSDLSVNSKLRDIRLAGCPEFNGIWDFSKNPELEILNLSLWGGARGVLDFSENRKLQKFWLAECLEVTGLSDLSNNPALNEVSLYGCTGLANRQQIAEDLRSKWPHGGPPPTIEV
ncbi:MAG: hypothetical protein J0H72_04075 [Burkholderiales bacterium]|nr:hypothetical protein [Burkholderiales bacterium]